MFIILSHLKGYDYQFYNFFFVKIASSELSITFQDKECLDLGHCMKIDKGRGGGRGSIFCKSQQQRFAQ